MQGTDITGDAERGPAASSFNEDRQRPDGWTDEDGAMWIRTYESNELGSGPNIGSGDNHFHGGNDSSDSRISQYIDLSAYSSRGYTDSIGPVTPENRNDKTDFRHRQSSGRVPASARSVRVVLISRYYDGANNVDGYADELSLTLHSSRP